MKDFALCFLLIGLVYAISEKDPVAILLMVALGFVAGLLHLNDKVSRG